MKPRLLIILSLMLHYACAQVSQNVKADSDSVPVQPGTIRVNASVIAVKEKTATLKIVSVKSTGQGIINILSEGQEVVVQLRSGDVKAGYIIEADLQEKMGVDASQSSYVLLRAKKQSKKL
jgi:hypothetical protein